MHELSIAQNIIEIAETNAKNNHAKSITEIELEIGSISGVVPEALEFAMDEAIKNTMLEQAHVTINLVQAKAKCSNCNTEFLLQYILDICPVCQGTMYDILQGKELRVTSIQIE